MRGISVPCMSAYSTTSDSSRPRLPGGFVSEFQRSQMRFSIAGSAMSGISIFKFKCQYLQVCLLESSRVASGDPLRENRVDARVSDYRDWRRRLAHDTPRRDHPLHKTIPRLAS